MPEFECVAAHMSAAAADMPEFEAAQADMPVAAYIPAVVATVQSVIVKPGWNIAQRCCFALPSQV